MGQEDEKSLAEVGDLLDEHIEAAIENAQNETTKFHLRHTKQLILGLETLIDEREDDQAETANEPSA